ncbi:MAG: metal-sulfur cluster assembly factor [Parcubacteria group bacterium]|jgi:metal-sulfur cluster biosynthetic enzyme
MYIDKDLLQKLHTVIDPELNIPITDMGLIYGIKQVDDTVHVTMTLTTIGCPLYDVIHDEIVRTLTTDPSIKDVQIELTFDPPWTPDMMTDATKMEIGFL